MPVRPSINRTNASAGLGNTLENQGAGCELECAFSPRKKRAFTRRRLPPCQRWSLPRASAGQRARKQKQVSVPGAVAMACCIYMPALVAHILPTFGDILSALGNFQFSIGFQQRAIAPGAWFDCGRERERESWLGVRSLGAKILGLPTHRHDPAHLSECRFFFLNYLTDRERSNFISLVTQANCGMYIFPWPICTFFEHNRWWKH